MRHCATATGFATVGARSRDAPAVYTLRGGVAPFLLLNPTDNCASCRRILAESMTTTACPFCTLPPERILGENHHAIWLRDGYPVSPGHSLIIPKRHVGSFFKATGDERLSLFALLDDAKRVAQDVLQPDGFNIGINDGAAAGQTVPHLHIHLIPRYRDDMADPRGGVRWVIPALADYWSKRPAP